MHSQMKPCFIIASVEKVPSAVYKAFSPPLDYRKITYKKVSFWICITLFIPKTTIICLTVSCDLIFVKKCLYETCLKWSFSHTER